MVNDNEMKDCPLGCEEAGQCLAGPMGYEDCQHPQPTPAPQGALPTPTDEAEKLRQFALAYPEEVFPPVSTEQRAFLHVNHPGLQDRIAAAMGRHFAKFATAAADHIDAQARQIADLKQALHGYQTCSDFEAHQRAELAERELTAAKQALSDAGALREIETAWIAKCLGDSIANLGYPVGMGIPPSEEALSRAANMLFDRFVKLAAAIAQDKPQEGE